MFTLYYSTVDEHCCAWPIYWTIDKFEISTKEMNGQKIVIDKCSTKRIRLHQFYLQMYGAYAINAKELSAWTVNIATVYSRFIESESRLSIIQMSMCANTWNTQKQQCIYCLLFAVLFSVCITRERQKKKNRMQQRKNNSIRYREHKQNKNANSFEQ